MIYHSISDYLFAKNIFEQTPLRIDSSGRIFSFVDGEWIVGADFDKPHYEHETLSNPDKSNISTGCISAKNK